MRYDSVIYDLDGTLLNTIDDLAASVNHTMRAFGYPEHSVSAVCRMVGSGMENLMRRALPADVPQAHFDGALAAFKAHYAEHSDDLTCAYPGIDDLLQALAQAGVKQAILSNKGDPFVKELSARYFGSAIAHAVGDQPGVPRKPAPDSTLRLMADMGCDPARTLYVGDSDVDILTARNAGVDCASVTWGFRPEEELGAAGASILIRTPEELRRLVLG